MVDRRSACLRGSWRTLVLLASFALLATGVAPAARGQAGGAAPLASQDEWVASDTSGINEKVPAGGMKRYWAKFPAPPPEVKTVTVFMAQTEPFEDVPITDK